ncbi:MAG: hypothetical protein VZS44_04325, partial [Bacilli bacterium]|nr:hypothetical protein [Bacilli bacterium]
YSGFTSVSGLPTTILDGESKNVTFSSTNGIPSVVEVNNATSSYSSPTLSLSNATNNVVITRKYTITYVDFTGNISGLISSMSSSGGTITFDSTTSIPDSVTVTGATGSYSSPTLSITNVTGDISITATYSVVSGLAYETLINIYNNSVASTDSTCDNSLLRDNTTDTNLRFTGNKPCNYVYFNCSDVDNPTSSTCEKWRIIGVFNKNNHQVLKIINSTFYNSGGNVQFNSVNNSSGVLWGTNTLSTTFNTTYYNSMAHTDNHDFIENVNWSIGATNNLGVKPDVLYTAENASITSSSLPFGLLSVTDINYGTSVTSCYDTTVNRWSSSCMTKASYDWLFEGNEYTLIPYSTTSYYVYKMQTNYQPYRTAINSNLPARVVTHLKTNVYFDGGVGSESNPYILKLSNN